MIPYLACMIAVAHGIGLPPRVLPVIQLIEGGAVGEVRRDSNGTADLGVMQVNTTWLPNLATQARLTVVATRALLIDDACFNIAAAALILRRDLAETPGALLPAIGDYHSHTPPLNAATWHAPKQRPRLCSAGDVTVTTSKCHKSLRRPVSCNESKFISIDLKSSPFRAFGVCSRPGM